jgi:hypothetical protein
MCRLISRDYSAIDDFYFIFRYLTDRLIYYGTREHAGEGCLQLANLMFSTIFLKGVFRGVLGAAWPENLSKWVWVLWVNRDSGIRYSTFCTFIRIIRCLLDSWRVY